MDDKDAPEFGTPQIRSLTYVTCQKHGVQYPRGSVCPECVKEVKDGK